jgi:beta-phosphoglucomutase
MIRAVIFDFDGVIANTEPLHFTAFRDVLSQEAVTMTEQDYYGRYLGYDDAGVFRAASLDRGLSWSDRRVSDLVERKATRLEELERHGPGLFPGAESAIRRLAPALPLAIASGALRAEIVRVLERNGLTQFFCAIVAAGDTPAGKPAPDPYVHVVGLLAAATGHPLTGRECIAVEDSRWGLQSARAAGLRTVGVTHTYPAGDLSSADLVIEHLDSLDLASLARIGNQLNH